jgi:hypothetical protein
VGFFKGQEVLSKRPCFHLKGDLSF